MTTKGCPHVSPDSNENPSSSSVSTSPTATVCESCAKRRARKKRCRDKSSKSTQRAKWDTLGNILGFYEFLDAEVEAERESEVSIAFKERQFKIDVRDDERPLKHLAAEIRDEINRRTDYRWWLVHYPLLFITCSNRFVSVLKE